MRAVALSAPVVVGGGGGVGGSVSHVVCECPPVCGAPACARTVQGRNNVLALDGVTGALIWGFAAGDVVDASPCLGPDGTVFVGSYDHQVYALNGATGALVWSFATQGSVFSSATLASDGGLVRGPRVCMLERVVCDCVSVCGNAARRSARRCYPLPVYMHACSL
jgi:outer membrane protein assembly factor BamB